MDTGVLQVRNQHVQGFRLLVTKLRFVVRIGPLRKFSDVPDWFSRHYRTQPDPGLAWYRREDSPPAPEEQAYTGRAYRHHRGWLPAGTAEHRSPFGMERAAGAANPGSSASAQNGEVCREPASANKPSGPPFFRVLFSGRAMTNSPGVDWDIHRMPRRMKPRDGLRIKYLAVRAKPEFKLHPGSEFPSGLYYAQRETRLNKRNSVTKTATRPDRQKTSSPRPSRNSPAGCGGCRPPPCRR